MDSNTIRDNQCVICTQNYTKDHTHSPTELKCGHVFGRSCIVEWRKISRSCPMCRQHFVIPKAPPDTSLITQSKKLLYSNKLPYCVLAGTIYLFNPSALELASLHVLSGAAALSAYGTIRVCTSIINPIRGYLGYEPCKPMQLREIVPHCIICCPIFIGSYIAAKLTSNPQSAWIG